MKIRRIDHRPMAKWFIILAILFPSIGISQTWRDTLQYEKVTGVGVSRDGIVGDEINNAIVEQHIRFHLNDEKSKPGVSGALIVGTTVVTTTNDTGDGSLRKAILNANANPGKDIISFNIPPAGLKSIMLLSKLPNIVDSVIIDGTTQPGFVDKPMIEINCFRLGPYDGLDMYAGNSTVRGLVFNLLTRGSAIVLWTKGNNIIEGNFFGTDISGYNRLSNVWNAVIALSPQNRIGGTTPASRNIFSGSGYGYPSVALINGAGKDLVQGNYFGTDVTGKSLLGSGGAILVDYGSSNDTIGGTEPGARNIISGSEWPYSGIDIAAPPGHGSTRATVVQGNFIGTDLTGINNFGNGGNGIHIINSADNIIGGTELGARNVISGNQLPGIYIINTLARGNTVQGNLIGTDSTGNSPMGNLKGIVMDNAPNNLIGGTAGGAGNVISGNFRVGVFIRDTSSNGNRIEGNFIGTRVDGVTTLPNDSSGILVNGGRDNTIGGSTREAGNVIAGNGADGISIVGATAARNKVQYNEIFWNGNLGIDLSPAGLTKNDSLDPDIGPNNLQNFPILDSATLSPGSIRIRGRLDSQPYLIYTVDFFRNNARNSSHFGEGEKWIGSATLLCDATGRADINVTLSANVGTDQFITATATDPFGNTSEFSRALCLSDIDGDGLLDCWESEGDGIDVNADGVIDLDLHAKGAQPDHKDLFVEVDFMDTYKPSDDKVLGPVRAAFQQANNYLVNNPDGNNGINLHAELDASDVITPPVIWAEDPWPEFLAAKQAHFGTTADRSDPYTLEAKKLVYRYCIFARAFGPLRKKNSGSTRTVPGNDFFVSLGRWRTPGGTNEEQAGSFMHELGHSLGLEHGGGDEKNYKPNYYSVMNYLFQVPTNDLQPGTWKLDYSPTVLNYLEEGHLPEFLGLMSAGSVGWYSVVQIPYRRPDNTIAQATLKSNTGVDWDGNGDSTGYAVFPVDVNHIDRDEPSSPLETLYGHADWPNLIYNFRTSPGPSGSPQVSSSYAQTDFGELTQEQVDSLRMLPPYGIVEPLIRWPSDPNTNIPIATASSSQGSPVIAGDGKGGAIIAYSWNTEVGGPPGEGFDIYAQRIDALGGVQWINNGVPICTAKGEQQTTAMTSDGAGGAIIVWQDKRDDQYDVYAQRINEMGRPLWPADGVRITASANESRPPFPVVTSDSSGGAIVAWRDGHTGTYSVYAQRIGAEGIVRWPEGGTLIGTWAAMLRDTVVQIISDDSGGAIIAWVDKRTGAGLQANDIYAQRVDSGGVVRWATDGIPLSDQFNEQNWPRLTPDGSGGAIVVWHDLSSYRDELYVQHVNANGQAQWTPNGVPLSEVWGGTIYPEITSDGKGGAIIAWMDYKRTRDMFDVYAQRVNASGAVMWQSDGVAICDTIMSGLHPTIVSDMHGGALITFSHQRGSDMDIYAQRIDSSGTTQWTKHGLPVCTAKHDQWFPVSTSDNAGGAIVSWYDHRKDSTSQQPHIYAQNLNGTGGLGGELLTGVEDRHPRALPTGFSLSQNYPNPFNPVTTIRYEIPKTSYVTLKVYNILGQVVAVLVDEAQEAGQKSVKWNASRCASGIYFYRLKAGSFVETRKLLLMK